MLFININNNVLSSVTKFFCFKIVSTSLRAKKCCTNCTVGFKYILCQVFIVEIEKIWIIKKKNLKKIANYDSRQLCLVLVFFLFMLQRLKMFTNYRPLIGVTHSKNWISKKADQFRDCLRLNYRIIAVFGTYRQIKSSFYCSR